VGAGVRGSRALGQRDAGDDLAGRRPDGSSVRHLLVADEEVALRSLADWSATGALLLAVGLYYLWTLSLGARATIIAPTDLKSVLFTFYELFGLLGLGPSRLAIRTGDVAVFKPYLPGLLAYGLLLAALLGLGWRRVLSLYSRGVCFCGGWLWECRTVFDPGWLDQSVPFIRPSLYTGAAVAAVSLGLGLAAAWRNAAG